MASAAVDDRPLTADMLAAHLAEGCKPESQFRVGAEHEKFVFRQGSHAPVPYEPQGIKALMEGLMAFGWHVKRPLPLCVCSNDIIRSSNGLETAISMHCERWRGVSPMSRALRLRTL